MACIPQVLRSLEASDLADLPSHTRYHHDVVGLGSLDGVEVTYYFGALGERWRGEPDYIRDYPMYLRG